MAKSTAIKYIIVAGIGYLVYYLISVFPLESIIALGILVILLVGYWAWLASRNAE